MHPTRQLLRAARIVLRRFRVFLSALLLVASVPRLDAGEALPSPAKARQSLRLLRTAEIQKELRLDAAQREAVAAAVEKVDLPLWRLRDVPPERGGEEARRLREEFEAAWRRILSTDQQRRLGQILLRAEGWRTLQLPSLVDRLGLDDTQQAHYDRFLEAIKARVPPTVTELGLTEYRWIQAELTPPQRARMRELLGEPFDFSRCRVPEAQAPEIHGIETWINTPPLTLAALRGKVVVFHFWTFGCVNCVHNLPFYRAWHRQWTNGPVVVLGMHTPETRGERELAQLKKAVAERHLDYPIAVDNTRTNWTAWGNSVWPSTYLIDKRGYVRYWWYGELNWKDAHHERQVHERILQLVAERDSGLE